MSDAITGKINVKVRAMAYERTSPKTNLSEFKNDLDFVSKEELLSELTALREWVMRYSVIADSFAQPGGNLEGENVLYRNDVSVSDAMSGQDVVYRSQLPLRYYYYGGDIRNRKD